MAVTKFFGHLEQARYRLAEEDLQRILKDLAEKKGLRDAVVS